MGPDFSKHGAHIYEVYGANRKVLRVEIIKEWESEKYLYYLIINKIRNKNLIIYISLLFISWNTF